MEKVGGGWEMVKGGLALTRRGLVGRRVRGTAAELEEEGAAILARHRPFSYWLKNCVTVLKPTELELASDSQLANVFTRLALVQ